jgi:protein SCO1/2
MAGYAMNESLRHSLGRAALLLVALVAGCGSPAARPPLQGARIGGPFALVDQNGKPTSDRDFAGRYRLIYFGYTYCPDVCPTDLQMIGQALRRFEKDDPVRAARVQPIFISVDPSRDTPAVLKPYVAAFHPRLIGLTGSADQIARVAKAFGVAYGMRPGATKGNYAVDHSKIIYLLGPAGEPIAIIPDENVDAMTAELERWVK